MDERSCTVTGRAIQFALSALLAACVAGAASAQLPFFPGAEGYGGTWSGSAPAGGWFADADVYHVTTTQDLLLNGKGAPGTLRGAFVDHSNPSSPKQKISNRIVVFDVGGTFQLTQGKLDIKEVNNIYIAGQTAPSPVTVYGNMAQITKSPDTMTSNVILRYMSFRKGTGPEQDSLSFIGGDGPGDTIATNMILDHVTASWAEDENLSVANNNTNITVQYSLIHDALVSNHAYGSLIRPRVDSNVTFHHNLYANNSSRQARFGTYNGALLTADFRNNIIYNFRDRASYAGGSGEPEQEFANVNYVGNYIIAGPGTGSVPAEYGGGQYAFRVDKNITAQVYQSGNYIDPDEAPDVNQPDGMLDGSDTGTAMFVVTTPITDQSLTYMGTPFATPPVATQLAPAAYQQVVDHVGNWWWNRDAIDARVIRNVLEFTGVPLAASAPIAAELNGLLATPTVSHAGGYDADGDGIEDAWEQKHGGNLLWNADFDNDGYINLVEFINELGEFPAPAPIVFNGDLNNRYAHIMNWKTDDGGINAGSNWQPSKYDEAQINSGTAVVDSVGQHAGLLKVASNPGDVAALSVTAGWLDVNGSLVVGVEGTGTVNQTGGSVIADEILLGAEVGGVGVYNLSNGLLRTASLDQGGGSADFQLTGGVLSADSIGFDIENQGGMISPGTSIGQSHFHGNLTLTSGGAAIELASSLLSDKLIVDGQVVLGGALEVALIDGFTMPESGSWEIVTAAGGLDGNFASITDGFSVQKQGNSLMLLVGAAPVLGGDYNNDGIVDAADYTAWRDNLGAAAGTLPNDTDGGVIGQAQYDTWVANFGAAAAASGAGALTNSAVPEPDCVVLAGAVLAGLIAGRRRLWAGSRL